MLNGAILGCFAVEAGDMIPHSLKIVKDPRIGRADWDVSEDFFFFFVPIPQENASIWLGLTN